MKKLEKILQSKKCVWFRVSQNKKQKFLAYAKACGCHWVDGQEIDWRKDCCGGLMGIGRDLSLGYVSPMCWIYRSEDVLKIDF